MISGKKDKGKVLIYSGFSILGGVLCAIYGFAANRFQTSEIIFLVAGGIVAGIALGLICEGMITSLRE